MGARKKNAGRNQESPWHWTSKKDVFRALEASGIQLEAWRRAQTEIMAPPRLVPPRKGLPGSRKGNPIVLLPKLQLQ